MTSYLHTKVLAGFICVATVPCATGPVLGAVNKNCLCKAIRDHLDISHNTSGATRIGPNADVAVFAKKVKEQCGSGSTGSKPVECQVNGETFRVHYDINGSGGGGAGKKNPADLVIAIGGDSSGTGRGGDASAENTSANGAAVAVAGNGGSSANSGGDGGNAKAESAGGDAKAVGGTGGDPANNDKPGGKRGRAAADSSHGDAGAPGGEPEAGEHGTGASAQSGEGEGPGGTNGASSTAGGTPQNQ